MGIISCQSALVVLVVLALTTIGSTEAKATQKPKYQYTKKPIPHVTAQNPVTTSIPKTLKIVPTPNPVQPQPQPITERSIYSSHSFPHSHSQRTEPPGVGPENYTLDYNECYFNFCECCPPERGPRGPKGDRGLEGIIFTDIEHSLQKDPVFKQCFFFVSLGLPGERGPAGSPGLPGQPGFSGPIGFKGDKGQYYLVSLINYP